MLDIGGRPRDYILHVPADLPAGPRPLVLESHGRGGTADNVERLTGLQVETDARGWLVARPNGVDRQWNDGRPEVRAGIDDVAFLAAVIDDVAGRTPVDPDRVYATGISNGALMSGRLACELSDRIAAIGQVAGTRGSRQPPATRRPVVGHADQRHGGPVVPSVAVRSGRSSGSEAVAGRSSGPRPTSASWVERDAAGLAAARRLRRDTTITRSVGSAGSEVVFYRVDGAGHTWPGGRQYLPKLIVGSTIRTFSASRVIMCALRGPSGRPRDRADAPDSSGSSGSPTVGTKALDDGLSAGAGRR